MPLLFRRHGLFLALYAEMFQEYGNAETGNLCRDQLRDGLQWERTWDRKPLVPRGPPGSFDHGQTESGTGAPVDVGEDVGNTIALRRRDREPWPPKPARGFAG